jgi:hypothetical protein
MNPNPLKNCDLKITVREIVAQERRNRAVDLVEDLVHPHRRLLVECLELPRRLLVALVPQLRRLVALVVALVRPRLLRLEHRLLRPVHLEHQHQLHLVPQLLVPLEHRLPHLVPLEVTLVPRLLPLVACLVPRLLRLVVCLGRLRHLLLVVCLELQQLSPPVPLEPQPRLQEVCLERRQLHLLKEVVCLVRRLHKHRAPLVRLVMVSFTVHIFMLAHWISSNLISLLSLLLGASAFGSPAPAPGGGMFGAPGPAPGAFGAPSPGGLYGAPAPAPGGMFGAKPPGTSLFGAPAMAPAPAYGAPMQAPYQYGAPAPPAYGAPMPAAPPVGSVMPPGANEILTSQLTALENKRKEIEKSDNFRSKPAESSLVNAVTLSENEGLSSLTPIRASYPTYRASPRSSAKVRPRGFASPEKMTTPSLSRLGSGGRPMAGPDSFVASSATRLVINPSPKPKMRLMLESAPLQNGASPLKITVPDRANGMPPLSAKATDRSMPTAPAQETRASPTGHGLNTPGRGGKGFDYYQQVIGSPDEAAGSASPSKKNVAPKLTKAGYSCTPSIEALQAMPAEDLAAVPEFSMTRAGVGKIEWEGAVDVRGADFDSVVIIEPKSASVYMKEEEENMKPPVGTKLNRSAILTLEGVFAPDDTQGAHERFAKKVERQTKKMGAELISFDAIMGEWKL